MNIMTTPEKSRLIRNLEFLIAKARTSPYTLEKETGVPQPTIHRILTGESSDPRTKTLQPLAERFGVSVSDLRDRDLTIPTLAIGLGKDLVEAVAFREERRAVVPRTDVIELSVYDVQASMGAGAVAPAYEDVIEKIRVSASWLRSQVSFSSPTTLGIITGYGDSMEGTFNDGDPLLVDRGVNEVKIDAVYVLELNDELYIKRLQRRPDGSILMISDNKKYDPYVIKNGELDRFRILGRVLLVWNAKKL